ncbi:MAG TPA: glycosyltransferase [Candidatus Binatia bacterium]|nr:glycosyltransferase [Candidatus Binatia bacterium]
MPDMIADSEVEKLRLPHRSLVSDLVPVVAKGKFFFVDGEKFFLKGVTYGPFAPASHGAPFPERPVMEQDFILMRELGANTLRTFTVPPRWLLDLAGEYGLHVLVGIPWAEHVAFLDSPPLVQDIRRTIADGVRACRGHAAVLACLMGNEIPPDIARWHGPERVRTFLRELVEVAKTTDPGRLVSYANFPSTEYLDVDFADFVSFNVYLHQEHSFRNYLSHLHNLAEDKPLVLTEFGIDSIREGQEFQAQTLAWQVRASFEMGVAGSVIFAWTDDWYALPLSGEGGFQVEDWAFGLVDRERRKKPAFRAVQQYYHEPLPPALPEYPKVSVVVCAHNAERTMAPCLASLEKLHYPNYEVIVVNDGSQDRTREICERFEFIRLINQENKGLSAARNVGIEAAIGEIVAFTDSDCVADTDWLTYLVATFVRSGRAAVGGPNFPPPEDTLVPSAVAVSPGGPTHVLLNDEVAEHIPGCNMAFRKEALEEINGFDPVFRAAGDDVDLCWRLQNQGYQIGFSPAAVVWHFRRNTVRAYLNQQRGYGKAEAQLYFKHPYRFNLLGQSRWLGRIYGDLSSFFLSRHPVIYSGAFGRGLFQTVYEPPSSLMAFLPLTLEWNVAAIALFLAALAGGGYLWLGAIFLLMSFGWCMASASRARIDSRFDNWRARLLVAMLAYLGPLVRSFERYRWRVRGLTEVEPIHYAEPRQEPEIAWRERALRLSYWSEQGLEKENMLYGLMEFLLPRKYLIALDQGWSDWDVEVSRGIWSKAQVKLGTENHSGLKRLLRVYCAVRMSGPARLALASCAALGGIGLVLRVKELVVAMMLLGLVNLATILYQNFRLGRVMYHALEIVAQRIGLSPVYKNGKA